MPADAARLCLASPLLASGGTTVGAGITVGKAAVGTVAIAAKGDTGLLLGSAADDFH